MSKLSLSIYLNSYTDTQSSNNPSLNNVKWDRAVPSLPVKNPISQAFSVAPGETKALFSGTRTLSHDNTTEYSISAKPLSANTYILTAVNGTLPNFRTPRSIGIDATTQITVTVNGPVVTFTSTGGTNMNTTSVVIGDFVNLGSLFNSLNQGSYKIIAKSATSISIENRTGTPEGPITLGVGFASQIQVFSASGVQINDTIIISGGFSPASYGSYVITAVYANSLEFYTTNAIPQESNILTQAINIYSAAKQLVYLESDNKVDVILNGINIGKIEPFIIGAQVSPGVFMLKSTIYSLSILNNGLNTANIMLIAAE